MPLPLQSIFVDGNGTNPTTVAISVQKNSLIVIGIWAYNLGGTPITDTFGLDWFHSGAGGTPGSNVHRAGLANDRLDIAYAFTKSNSGTTTISITTLTTASLIVVEVPDVIAVDNSDDHNSASDTTGGGTVGCPNLNTTDQDFIFAVAFSGLPSSPPSPGTGLTTIQNGEIHYSSFGDLGSMTAAYQNAATPGSYPITFGVVNAPWIIAAIAFKTGPPPGPTAECIPVGDIVLDVCKRAGIDASLVDVSLLTAENLKPTNLCCGYVITRPTPAAQILQTLMQAFFFDMVESDGILKCVPRGLASVVTIPEDELGLEADKAKLVETIGQEQDLPFRVTTLYNDENADYQQGKQEATRNSRIVSTRNQEIITMPLTMNADFGRQIAQKALYLRWLERNGYSTNLWKAKYMLLDPADVLQFIYEGMTFQIRVVDTSIGQGFVVAINGVGDNARNYLSTAQGGSATTGGGTPPIDIAPPTLLFLFDIPLLRDQDSNATGTGYYYAMSSGANNWAGGVLFKSSDDTSFAFEDSDGDAVNFGYTTNVLPPPRSPWTWDYVNTLNVMMVNGTLDSDTDLNVLNGSRAIIANGEIIQWVNSTLETDGSYTLSKLLRGRRGTELQTGSHAVGELVVDLHSGMKRIADPLSLLNQLRYYRGVTNGQDPSAVASQQMTIRGNDLKPYAPGHIVGTRDVDGNLTINWIRRTRIGGAWLDNVGTVPLSETSEKYDVDILSGATVVRTFTDLPSPTLEYAQTDQEADFGGAQAAVAMNIFQKSSVVGRGFAGSATV